MIISRTPLRISFVGGGTDLQSFFVNEDGVVLSTAIDKYVYVSVKRQLDIVEHKYKIGWRKTEFADRIDDIEHPIVREALRMMKIDHPIEIITFADVPANTGLGSSSAFAVGLLHALLALRGQLVTKATLAAMAGEIEVEVLGRNIGKQDHYAAAYGNINVFTFRRNGSVGVEPVFYSAEGRQRLEQRLLLFYTGVQRDASEALKHQHQNPELVRPTLQKMKELVEPLRASLMIGHANVGEILHQGWTLKRSLSGGVSSPLIDRYYEQARRAGATGGKLLGAGGGGFLLLYAEPETQAGIAEALSGLHRLPFKLDTEGTRITYFDQNVAP